MKTERRQKTGNEPRVLVVDPDTTHQEQLASALRVDGFRVVTVARYDSTEPLYGMFAPDVVVICTYTSDPVAVITGRKLWQLSRRTLPLFYGMPPECDLRAACFGRGHAVGVLPIPMPVRELTERIRGLLSLKRGIQRASDAEAGERHSFFHDPTTGVFSRQYLLAQIGQELRRSERHGGGFSIVNVALPGYVRLKRQTGRAAAERMLIWSAGILTDAVRAADVVARTAEDEFSLLLPGASAEELTEVKARIAGAFEGSRLQLAGESFAARLNLGSVSFPDAIGNAPQLLELAVLDRRRQDFQKFNVVTRLPR